MKKKTDLLIEGMWLTRLFSVVADKEGGHVVWFVVGIYKTAQEAFLQGNAFAEKNSELFSEQLKGDLPEHLVIERMLFGTTPNNIKDQYIFGQVSDQNGPYLDIHGVTRPSFMLAQGLATLSKQTEEG